MYRKLLPGKIFNTYFYYLFFLLLASTAAAGQAVGKISPKVSRTLEKKSAEREKFVIALSTGTVFSEHIKDLPGVKILYYHPASFVCVVETSISFLQSRIIPLEEVLFVDQLRVPIEEVAVSNIDMSVNRVTTLQHHYPQYQGAGIQVSVKENRPDTADIDFRGRYLVSPFVSPTLSSHATIISTLIAGAGNSYYEGKGVAPAASFNSVSFANLLPEPDGYYQQFDVGVQNHSYGTGIENYYGGDARAYDASVLGRPSLVHVFSAGNSGMAAGTGNYAGLSGFANTTGSFKMAKNILTVGHTDSLGMVLPASSTGPAYDGRVMPSLVAFGEDGSSGAAAIVSGIASVMQNAYETSFGSLPSSSLVRALLINGADEAGSPGIDFKTGYGSANAYRSLLQLVRGQFFSGNLIQGGEEIHTITIPAFISNLKITLAWNDLPATANAPRALINDLDLELVEVSSGNTWLPWVLSHFPHPDSLNKLPVRKKDEMNTIEQISVEFPSPGIYQLRVKGFNVQGSQSYHLAYCFDTLDKFEWLYPTASDKLPGAQSNVIRWSSGFSSNSLDSIQVSFNGSGQFQTIARAPFPPDHFKWMVPDIYAKAVLRMHRDAQQFESDTFTLGRRMEVRVGFHCADSFSLNWPALPGVSHYRIYQLGGFFMEPFQVVQDTMIVLQKNVHPSMHYAIAPMVENWETVRSYAYDYRTQGVDCYLRSFFATLSGSQGILDLEVGTSYGIQSITFQKLGSNGFVDLATYSASLTAISYQYADQLLNEGANTYRVRILLMNGQQIFSTPETIFFFGSKSYIVYPNPLRQGGSLVILNNRLEISTLRIFNSSGAEVRKISIELPVQNIDIELSRGLYFLEFTTGAGRRETIKLLVQ